MVLEMGKEAILSPLFLIVVRKEFQLWVLLIFPVPMNSNLQNKNVTIVGANLFTHYETKTTPPAGPCFPQYESVLETDQHTASVPVFLAAG